MVEARTSSRATLAYVGLLVLLVAIAGGALYAFRDQSVEIERLAEANRGLGDERDALKVEVQVERKRASALEGEAKSLQERSAALAAEKDRLTTAAEAARELNGKLQGEIAGERQRAEKAQERLAALSAEQDALAQKIGDAVRQANEAEAARDAARAAQQEERRGREQAEQRAQALAAEKDALAMKLADIERQTSAAVAAARADLARELKKTEQSLDDVKSRSAQLNRDYERLLKDKTKLSAADAARRAELEKTKKAFEEVQSEIARLTGARGIYTVQDSDSLSKIATFFYRNGNRWPDIFKANAFLIDGPDKIYPGQVLIVPK